MTIPRLCVGLPAEVVSIRAYQQLGYSNPTASQKEAILEFVKGRDVFVLGEGKISNLSAYPSPPLQTRISPSLVTYTAGHYYSHSGA